MRLRLEALRAELYAPLIIFFTFLPLPRGSIRLTAYYDTSFS
jgi:hypothetical protein